MFGLSTMPSSDTRCSKSAAKTACNTRSRDLLAALDRVRAVHQDLGLHDRHDVLFLAERRVTSQGMGVRGHARVARERVAHRDHRAPLRESRSHLAVLLESLTESVESFGHLLRGRAGERLGSQVDLDAGKNAQTTTHRSEWRSVGTLLADRLVVDDHAAQELRRTGRGDQQLAIVSPTRWRRRNPECVEALRQGGHGFVGRENPLATRDERAGRLLSSAVMRPSPSVA